ncbi:MAG: TetR/AcrR family transcriptional regulator [Methyloligellaceae bacterium]
MSNPEKTTTIPSYEMESMMRRQPKQERSLKRVEQILNTASELILEVGLESVNAGLISKRTGIPVGTIYQFFTDMEAVSTEIIIRIKKRLDGKIMEELHASTITKDYRRGIEDTINVMINGFKSEPYAITVLQALLHTKSYIQSTKITKQRLSDYFAESFLHSGFGVELEQSRIISDLIFESGYGVFEKILLEPDLSLSQKYKEEWLKMLIQYLSPYLETNDLEPS